MSLCLFLHEIEYVCNAVIEEHFVGIDDENCSYLQEMGICFVYDNVIILIGVYLVLYPGI